VPDGSASGEPEAIRIDKMTARPGSGRRGQLLHARRVTPGGPVEVIVSGGEESKTDEQSIELSVSLAPPPPFSRSDSDWWHSTFAERGLRVDGGSHGPQKFELCFQVRPDDLEDVARTVMAIVNEAAPIYQPN
jgi:hypothetical protein